MKTPAPWIDYPYGKWMVRVSRHGAQVLMADGSELPDYDELGVPSIVQECAVLSLHASRMAFGADRKVSA